MLGVSLMTAGTVLEEVSSTIGKVEMRKRVETPFTYGVITTSASVLFFVCFALFRLHVQHFSLASIPTVAIRFVLEIVQATVTIHALKFADRSTFGFLRTLTIPFLLGIDIVAAYTVDSLQIFGICLIVFSLLLLYLNHGFSKKGSFLVLVSALNAVLTISLYKYNITHFNSPEVEQTIILCGLLIYFVAMARWYDKVNPFSVFRQPACLAQAGLLGVCAVVDSMSFLFAAPSVLLAAKRTTSVFMSVLLGRTVFKEKHLVLKISAFSMCAIGFVLLAT